MTCTIHEDCPLDEEIVVLEAIYINELVVARSLDHHVSEIRLVLHPATGDETDRQYVRITLVIRPSPNYPDELPDISIQNSRGLSDSQIRCLKEALNLHAETQQGWPMIHELIETAKDTLTAGNLPHGPCPICLDHFTTEDDIQKTVCYHFFHRDCLLEYCDRSQGIATTTRIIPCPICREEIKVDIPKTVTKKRSPNHCDFVPDAYVKALQEKMQELYLRQKEKGGIIDIEAEKNRFLVQDGTVLLPQEYLQDSDDDVAPGDENRQYQNSMRRGRNLHTVRIASGSTDPSGQLSCGRQRHSKPEEFEQNGGHRGQRGAKADDATGGHQRSRRSGFKNEDRKLSPRDGDTRERRRPQNDFWSPDFVYRSSDHPDSKCVGAEVETPEKAERRNRRHQEQGSDNKNKEKRSRRHVDAERRDRASAGTKTGPTERRKQGPAGLDPDSLEKGEKRSRRHGDRNPDSPEKLEDRNQSRPGIDLESAETYERRSRRHENVHLSSPERRSRREVDIDPDSPEKTERRNRRHKDEKTERPDPSVGKEELDSPEKAGRRNERQDELNLDSSEKHERRSRRHVDLTPYSHDERNTLLKTERRNRRHGEMVDSSYDCRSNLTGRSLPESGDAPFDDDVDGCQDRYDFHNQLSQTFQNHHTQPFENHSSHLQNDSVRGRNRRGFNNRTRGFQNPSTDLTSQSRVGMPSPFSGRGRGRGSGPSGGKRPYRGRGRGAGEWPDEQPFLGHSS